MAVDSRPTVGRQKNCVVVNMTTDSRPTEGMSCLGEISAKCRWNIGEVSVVYRPSVSSLSVSPFFFVRRKVLYGV